jgi:hypothetical protein
MGNRFSTYRASLASPNEFRAEVTQTKQTNEKIGERIVAPRRGYRPKVP